MFIFRRIRDQLAQLGHFDRLLRALFWNPVQQTLQQLFLLLSYLQLSRVFFLLLFFHAISCLGLHLQRSLFLLDNLENPRIITVFLLLCFACSEFVAENAFEFEFLLLNLHLAGRWLQEP